MSIEQKKRMRELIIKYATVLAVGMGYWLFVKLTGWGIPCISRLITNKYCPGCGISRMFMALMRLDIVAAARYNLLVLCLLPFFLVLLVYKSVLYIKDGGSKMGKPEMVFYVIAFILAIAFAILRNTSLIPFLQIPE